MPDEDGRANKGAKGESGYWIAAQGVQETDRYTSQRGASNTQGLSSVGFSQCCSQLVAMYGTQHDSGLSESQPVPFPCWSHGTSPREGVIHA